VSASVLLPSGWPRPRGFSHGVAARGQTIFVAGQVGWNARSEFESDDFAEQVRQALLNVVAVLREAGAEPRHLVRMTWYVTDRRAYLAALSRVGEAYRSVIGKHYPAMTLVEVSGLLEERALVEIEATAVLPDA
jgi:enamine deaminase RidA (YjgF/YER057c/UK114 family)